MRVAGSGTELWRVRVDLFSEVDQNAVGRACCESLRALLTETDDEPLRCEAGVDGGTGSTSNIVGFLFWVRADDIGDAARLALTTAQQAGAPHRVGPEVYDVVVIPSASVYWDDPPWGASLRPYPTMPD